MPRIEKISQNPGRDTHCTSLPLFSNHEFVRFIEWIESYINSDQSFRKNSFIAEVERIQNGFMDMENPTVDILGSPASTLEIIIAFYSFRRVDGGRKPIKKLEKLEPALRRIYDLMFCNGVCTRESLNRALLNFGRGHYMAKERMANTAEAMLQAIFLPSVMFGFNRNIYAQKANEVKDIALGLAAIILGIRKSGHLVHLVDNVQQRRWKFINLLSSSVFKFNRYQLI